MCICRGLQSWRKARIDRLVIKTFPTTERLFADFLSSRVGKPGYFGRFVCQSFTRVGSVITASSNRQSDLYIEPGIWDGFLLSVCNWKEACKRGSV